MTDKLTEEDNREEAADWWINTMASGEYFDDVYGVYQQIQSQQSRITELEAFARDVMEEDVPGYSFTRKAVDLLGLLSNKPMVGEVSDYIFESDSIENMTDRIAELEAEKADNHARAEAIISAREKTIAELNTEIQERNEQRCNQVVNDDIEGDEEMSKRIERTEPEILERLRISAHALRENGLYVQACGYEEAVDLIKDKSDIIKELELKVIKLELRETNTDSLLKIIDAIDAELKCLKDEKDEKDEKDGNTGDTP